MSPIEGGWESVIGLEVHCELRTETKLFCGCANAFGAEPNTLICPVCLGLPGSLPVINRAAVELAMRIGLALNCEIKHSIFHRKNYFYPDMPKDYQVSQYDEPINVEGHLQLPDGSRVGIERAHMEEDTGKTTHVGTTGRIHGSDYSLVDYNRAGVPLVEIVSAPDIRSAEQAKAYVTELRSILVATGASDGKMEEGSLRVDANVSVRRTGDHTFGTRCEIKNLNSLRSLGRAIDFEISRQVELLESGESIRQETRHWDENRGETITGRSKEEAEDYRYFPEPDLVPLAPEEAWIQKLASTMPPLPAQRRAELVEKVGSENASAVTTAVELGLDDLILTTVNAGGDSRIALNRALNEVASAIENLARLDSTGFTELVQMESRGELTSTQAKAVLAEMLKSGGRPSEIAKSKGYEALDSGDLANAVDEVIAAHPQEADRFRNGETKLAGFFVGKVMAATQGKADGKAVTAFLRERLGS